MTINRPELANFANALNMPLSLTHHQHMISRDSDFHNIGSHIAEVGQKIGADSAIRSGTFADTMLGALDRVSSYQQHASNTNQAALLDPDSVDVHDITVAQAQARIALDITRNVLNRLVQSWRDIINTR